MIIYKYIDDYILDIIELTGYLNQPIGIFIVRSDVNSSFGKPL